MAPSRDAAEAFSAGPPAGTPFIVEPSGKSAEMRYDGQVAVVTGAGNGLGKTYALLLGSRGAKVVVNDLGGSHSGGGASTSAADQVVEQIKAMGGEAVASYDSVENGEAIVKTAIAAFGRIDILINNAGILRDVTLHNMKQQDWDMIYNVHIKGTYACTKAAWTHMRGQKYGRIVNVSSAAGLYGNFGQTNYSTAKLGLVGFTLACSREGAKHDVKVNVVAPLAGTRMMATVTTEELNKALRPEYVSPLVGYLVHANCAPTGGIFELGAGWISKLRWQRSEGVMFDIGKGAFSVEDIRDNYAKIEDFETNPTYPRTGADSMKVAYPNLERAAKAKGGGKSRL